jgi:hypothetical protein
MRLIVSLRKERQMDRFTFESDGYWAINNENCFEDQNEDYQGPAIDRFAAYENLNLTPGKIKAMRDELQKWRDDEAAGLTVRLPCNVGTKVFDICDSPYKQVRESKMTQVKINRAGQHFKTWWGYFHISDFGKTVFLSHKQAEAALQAPEETK